MPETPLQPDKSEFPSKRDNTSNVRLMVNDLEDLEMECQTNAYGLPEDLDMEFRTNGYGLPDDKNVDDLKSNILVERIKKN